MEDYVNSKRHVSYSLYDEEYNEEGLCYEDERSKKSPSVEVRIEQWPPTVDPNSSKIKLSTGGLAFNHEEKTVLKRYHVLDPSCDPHLGVIKQLDDLLRRTSKVLGLRRVFQLPDYLEDLRIAEDIRDQSVPVILVLGGLHPPEPLKISHGMHVMKYHPVKDRFEYVIQMTESRSNHAAAYLNNKVYITGGIDPESVKCGEMVPTSTVFCLDLKTVEWNMKAPMRCSRSFHSLVPVEGKLYAIGGRDQNGHLIASIECYDPQEDKWTTLRPMADAKMGMACVAHGHDIWCMGGIGNDKKDPVSDDVVSYNIVEERWTERPKLRTARAFATCVLVGNMLWLCCGAGSVEDSRHLVSMGSIDCFNLTTSQWEKKTVFKNKRHCAGITALESCIFMFGGMSSHEWSSLNRSEMYTTMDNSHHVCRDLPISLTGLATVTIPPIIPSMRARSLVSLLEEHLPAVEDETGP